MARAQLANAWVVSGDIAAVRTPVQDFLLDEGMEIVDEEPDRVEVRQGSQMRTRILGGWFVSPRTIPKRATVSLHQTADGVRIEASIEESMGFGLLDPIFKRKYEAYFADWMSRLRSVGG